MAHSVVAYSLSVWHILLWHIVECEYNLKLGGWGGVGDKVKLGLGCRNAFNQRHYFFSAT